MFSYFCCFTILGTSNHVVDNALARQFAEWLNSVPELSANNRTKRSTSKEDLLGRFLREVYPGANQIPTAMIRMLSNPTISPDRKASSASILHKDTYDRCAEPSSSLECPESFVSLENTDKCIHDPSTEMTFNGANTYMLNLQGGNANLFQFTNEEETKKLFEYVKSGKNNSIQKNVQQIII